MKQSKHFALKNRFTPAIQEGDPSISGHWFIFSGNQLLINNDPSPAFASAPFSPLDRGIALQSSQLFGYYDLVPCFLGAVEPDSPFTSMHPVNLRALFGTVDDDYFSLAGRALQILHHTREHIYCSRCASPMQDRADELARICPQCDFISFPRVSPAVIMSVVHDDHILLGRGPHFTKDMYSTLAGFVEAGETLEEAVCREVQEETNITVAEVNYVTSQPWPFPHSVMIGFSAQYVAGDIIIDKDELEDARWFHYKDLPKLPSKITIARLLIDNFLDSCKERYEK